MNFFPLSVLVWRDVTRGFTCITHLFGRDRPPLQCLRLQPWLGNIPPTKSWLSASPAGDKLAMQALFARHRTPVYRWLYRLVGSETLAEDLLSDVFFDVWQQAGRYQGRAALSTWLLSIARFKALSARRRRIDAPLDETIETTVADSADDPEITLSEEEPQRARPTSNEQVVPGAPRNHRPCLLPREIGR